MFDAGAPTPGALKFGRLLATHGHQDHLGALAYLVSQRHLMGLPDLQVHVPAAIVSPLRTILQAWSEIEGFSLTAQLHGHAPGDRVEVRSAAIGVLHSVVAAK